MEIIIAENAGFCFGVNRAVELTSKELLAKEGKIYSLGPLIHNPQAVKAFEKKGLKVLNNLDELENSNLNIDKVIIRSHGVSKYTIKKINDNNIQFTDTTCPYVKSIHNRVEEFKNQGYNIIIIGDPNHPEVIGINGWCENEGYVVNSINEAETLQNLDKVCVVCQTTYKKEKFELLSNIITTKCKNVKIFNTICNATKLRQQSCKDVASKVDAMIVIGGYTSSNTKKLVEISKENCKNVFHIETVDELVLDEIKNYKKIGITAGASTPDWIIKEVVETMDNINNNEMNEEMLEAIENSFTRIHRGDVLKGEVIFVTKNEVMVNINYKSDGIINRDELSNDPDVNPKDLYTPGDEIDVFVVKLDDGEGNVVLSTKRVDEFKNLDAVEEIYNNKERAECKIKGIVKGGLIAIVNGVNGFMPASQISLDYVSDLNSYKGKTLIAKIIDFDKEKRRIILSRKEVEKEELNNKRKELWATLQEGQVVEGVVRRLTDFGAFVDLGGLDGLVHISDLSWNRVKHPSNIVSIGQNIKVQVLSLDKEKNRISLGLKQTTEEPWALFSNNVSIGDVVEGNVVNLLDFGAFVRLKEGVDGLLHVSQISDEHVKKPSDVLNMNDKINVKVIDIDGENKKISLSIKAIESDKQKEHTETEVATDSNIEKKDLDTTIGDVINND